MKLSEHAKKVKARPIMFHLPRYKFDEILRGQIRLHGVFLVMVLCRWRLLSSDIHMNLIWWRMIGSAPDIEAKP